ncbi:hypothetical protein [Rhizobium leguminosarum]
MTTSQTMDFLPNARFFIAASLLAALTSCTSLDQISTREQTNQISKTERILVAHREDIRRSVDEQNTKGALIFTDNATGKIKSTFFGNDPLDAWLNHIKSTYSGPVTSLPLPSSISPTAAFIYSSKQLGRNELILSAKFDEDVNRYYDLARTMTRLGSDIQDVRDITVLLSISDKKQNESVLKLKETFEALAAKFGELTKQLASLEQAEETSRDDLISQLNALSQEMDNIRRLIESM